MSIEAHEQETQRANNRCQVKMAELRLRAFSLNTPHHHFGLCSPYKVISTRRLATRRFVASRGVGKTPEVYQLPGNEVSQDDFQQLCSLTVKTMAKDLAKSSLQPEGIYLIDAMQDVGQGLGLKVEYSRGQVITAKAGVAHQLAQSGLRRHLSDEGGWEILNGINLILPCDTMRQPDISGWRKPIKFDYNATQVRQPPDWVCEILSATTKEQDLPDGDKFSEYAESGIPYYWIIEPLSGQITVYQLVAHAYSLIQKASLSESTQTVLSPFGTKIDLMRLFEYIVNS